MLDAFNTDNFNVVSLTTAINFLPFVPTRIGSMGLFKPEGITTNTAVFEEENGKLFLIPSQPRGVNTYQAPTTTRKVRALQVPHFPMSNCVYADDVMGVRAFGSEDATETVNEKVNQKLTALKNAHELTKEFHRAGALKGIVLDADNTTVLYNLFELFGVEQQRVEFNFAAGQQDMKKMAEIVIDAMESTLGGTVHTGIHAFCGRNFFREFIAHPTVAGAYEAVQENSFARTQQNGVGGFEFAGITWEAYRGKVGSADFFPTDGVQFFPLGVPDAYAEINAPANYVETVNTVGKPYYAKQEPMKFGKGVEMETQSNALFICTRPRSLIQGYQAEE